MVNQGQIMDSVHHLLELLVGILLNNPDLEAMAHNQPEDMPLNSLLLVMVERHLVEVTDQTCRHQLLHHQEPLEGLHHQDLAHLLDKEHMAEPHHQAVVHPQGKEHMVGLLPQAMAHLLGKEHMVGLLLLVLGLHQGKVPLVEPHPRELVQPQVREGMEGCHPQVQALLQDMVDMVELPL